MDDIKSTLLLALVIITGVFTAPTCYNYLTARSQEIGIVKDLQKTEYVEEKDNYSITYNLDGGVVENNPDEYNLFTETFTLNNPTKQGYEFLGWTNETLTEPTFVVTIKQGSAGDIAFTANYHKNLEEPQISFGQSNTMYITWQAVENATGYILDVNGTEIKLENTSWAFDARVLKSGTNTFKVKAIRETTQKTFESPYSNTLEYYIAEDIESPVLSIEDNIITFNKVDNAQEYILVVGNSQTSITSFVNAVGNDTVSISIYENDDIEYLFYSQDNLEYFNSDTHTVPVYVKAVPYFLDLVAPGISNTINFEYPEFDKFNSLNIQANYQTVDMIADKGLMLDNNQYLCLLLSSSAGNLFDNNEYLSRYGFTVEISSNNEIVQTSLLNFGAAGVFYTKLNSLENLATYTVTFMFSNNYHDNYFVECFEVDFVLNTSQVWCITF